MKRFNVANRHWNYKREGVIERSAINVERTCARRSTEFEKAAQFISQPESLLHKAYKPQGAEIRS